MDPPFLPLCPLWLGKLALSATSGHSPLDLCVLEPQTFVNVEQTPSYVSQKIAQMAQMTMMLGKIAASHTSSNPAQHDFTQLDRA